MYRTKLIVLVASVLFLTTIAGGASLKATRPDPAHGAVGVTLPLLRWTKGDTAMFHDVYLGTTPDLTEADRVGSRLFVTMYYHVAGFTPGTVYYWRVDEIEANGATVHTGNVWSFITQAMTAYYPSPVDGANDVAPAPPLSWMAGTGATKHHVYFGDSLDAVTQGAAGADKGLVDLEQTTFAPGALKGATAYYWRVDEVQTDGSVKAGPVWTFTTYISVDDFESYTDDEGSRIYETWVDGWTNSTGSTVGYVEAPFAERVIIHGGAQAMPLDYNNVKAPHYAEAERTWTTAQDWTAGGVSTLTVFFRGSSANSAGRLYAALEDSAGKVGVVAHPDQNRIAMAAWTRWEIPLSEFSAAGVDLTRVKTLYIGVGDRANPVAGGTGTLIIDDIYVGGPGAILPVAVFAEDFEGLVLGPNVDEGVAGTEVWTETPPTGWVIDESGVPGVGDPANDGVTEWAGWSFANRLWWVETAGNQDRIDFVKGIGTVAIADPDEWDDAGHPEGSVVGWYQTYLSTAPIDISAVKSGTLELKFDSSWKPEFDDDYHQTANGTISFDGGPAVEVFRWESDSAGPNYKANATNETVRIVLDPPAGAKSMVVTFGLFDAGNDWWWAIDNIEVSGIID